MRCRSRTDHPEISGWSQPSGESFMGTVGNMQGDGGSARGGVFKGRALQPIRFGDFLVERQFINEKQLLDALAEHWMIGCRIGESVARRGYVPRADVERLAGEFQNLSVIYV